MSTDEWCGRSWPKQAVVRNPTFLKGNGSPGDGTDGRGSILQGDSMRRVSWTLAMLLCLAAASFADVGKEELKKLVQAGLSEDLILGYVHSKGPVARLSADDVIDLKKAGLSDSLLSKLIPLQAPAVE